MAELESTSMDDAAVQKQVDDVLQCCREGNTARLREMILKENADEVLGFCIDPSTGKTSIHIVAALGNTEMLEMLLEYGAPWNAVDNEYRTAGDDAEQAGQMECYEILLNHGCRSELILGLLGQKVRSNLVAYTSVSRGF
jgi:type IV protein arginine methyltransferase